MIEKLNEDGFILDLPGWKMSDIIIEKINEIIEVINKMEVKDENI